MFYIVFLSFNLSLNIHVSFFDLLRMKETTLDSNSSSKFPETIPSNSSLPTEVYSGDSSINNTLSYHSNVSVPFGFSRICFQNAITCHDV
mmetsp:Transcript_7922/g.16575  ORF Transcript_7922/g.16575 Transcript_7922/m.16575 type:complete len:90 (-) Transcript_7922:73-342(-)